MDECSRNASVLRTKFDIYFFILIATKESEEHDGGHGREFLTCNQCLQRPIKTFFNTSTSMCNFWHNVEEDQCFVEEETTQ